MEFVITFTDSAWVAAKVVKAPWNLVLKMGTNAGDSSRNRVQGSGDAWVKYPMTYDEWTWGTTCTNTQWGVDDADTTDSTPAATLKNATPACKVSAGATTSDMVIPIAEDLTTTDYSTFKIKFNIDIKMPKDIIG